MVAQVEVRRRRSKREQVSARYRRLRNELDLPTRMRDDELGDPGELAPWESRDVYDPFDHDYYRLDTHPGLDRAWRELGELIAAPGSFNPLPGLPPSKPARALPARKPLAELERRIVEHLRDIESGHVELARDEELDALAELCSGPLAGDWDLVVALALFRPFWLRSPQTWTPGRPLELVEHLLVAYDYPRFLLNAWDDYAIDLRWHAWMIAACQGASVRRLCQLAAAADCPGSWPTLSKKLPGLLAAVPAELAPSTGFMYAEVLRLGGTELEFLRILNAYLIDLSDTDPEEREFWDATVTWVSRHREQLDDHACRMVIAWARHMQIELERVGRRFRWAGRTPAAALREAREYDEALRRSRTFDPWLSKRWARLGLDWSIEIDDVRWEIRELCSGEALVFESARMHHCVRSYAYRCATRQCAIFSVARDGRPCLTVEMLLPSRRVVQVRGAYNRLPTRDERAVLERWLASLATG